MTYVINLIWNQIALYYLLMHLLLQVLVSLYLPQPANDHHREGILQELLG